eukprot:8169047-Pyramimonas_sp.AAC.1
MTIASHACHGHAIASLPSLHMLTKFGGPPQVRHAHLVDTLAIAGCPLDGLVHLLQIPSRRGCRGRCSSRVAEGRNVLLGLAFAPDALGNLRLDVELADG